MATQEYPIWIGESVYNALLACIADMPREANELTSRQRDLLSYIARHPGIATQDAAAAYGVIQSTMGTRLQRLVRLGLIRREYDRGNGAGKIARWTAI